MSLDNARYADDLQRLMEAARAVIGPPAANAPAMLRRRVEGRLEGGNEHVPVVFVARRAPAKLGVASAAAAVPP